MKSRHLLIASAVAITMLAAGCSSGGSGGGSPRLKPEKTDIVVNAFPAIDSAGLYIAQDEGLFAAQGLHVKIIPVPKNGPPPSTQNLVDGQEKGLFDITAGDYVTYFEDQLGFGAPKADLRIIAGTPKTVVAKLKRILEETRPGILALWGNDGRVSQEDSLTCIRLMGQEVFPAIREIAKELDLKSPFESNAPVHLRYSKDLKPVAKAAAE